MPKREVRIIRGREGYGFTLSGQAPCFVSWISKTSFAKDSGLQIGDYILSVNKENLCEADHDYVVKVIGMSSGVLLMEVVDGLRAPISSKADADLTNIKDLSSDADSSHNAKLSLIKFSSHCNDGKFYRTKRVLNELKNGSLFQDVFVALDSSPSNSDKVTRMDTTPRSRVKASRSSNQMPRNYTLPRNNSVKTCYTYPEELIQQTLVAYLGSVSGRIEAFEDVASMCMSALKSSIKQLRAEQDIHQRVVLKITSTGLKIFNADGDLMVLLDKQKLCFCSSCGDDDRFFSVATLHGSNIVKCYQFMVDPAMVSHESHTGQAKRFGIHCSMVSEGCLEFPHSPLRIMKTIESIYDDNLNSFKWVKESKHELFTGANVMNPVKLEDETSLSASLRSGDVHKHSRSESMRLKLDYRMLDVSSINKRSKSLASKLNMKNLSKSAESVRLVEPQCHSAGSSFESLSSDLFQCHGNSVASWSCSFDKLLEDPVGLMYFTEYLRKEFSEENIIFWSECEKLRKTALSNTSLLEELANNIYKCFLCEHASSPVNIDSIGQRLAEQVISKPPKPDMFLKQQNQIYKLMEYDSYPRFLKSNLYSQCHWCQINGLPLPLEKNLLLNNSQDDIRQTRHGFSSQSRRFFQKKPKKSRSVNEMRKDLSDCESKMLNPLKSEEDFLSSLSLSGSQACKLVFWDGSTDVVPVEEGKATIRQSLEGLCQKRNAPLSAIDIYYQNEDRALALDQNISVLAGQEIRVERRTLFKLDLLPIRRSIGVKAKPSKCTVDVLKPVLTKYGLDLDQVLIKLNGEEKPVDLYQSISALDGIRVTVDYNFSKTMPRKLKTNHVKDSEENISRSAENSDTEDLIVAMSVAAECGKLNDQRGLISQINLELPDFLKLPAENSNSSAKSGKNNKEVTLGPYKR